LFLNHLTKSDKRGWLTRWPPRSFANPIWHGAPSECANTQDQQNCCAVKSHSRVLATLQSNEKARKEEAIW